MPALDKLVAIYAIVSATLTGLVAVLSPSNIYAYLAAPIVAYFLTLSHHPLLRETRAKLFLDTVLALILLVIVAYRAYVFIESHG